MTEENSVARKLTPEPPNAASEMSGAIDQSSTRETNDLVIGEWSSPEWIHATFGRSMERAIELRDPGHGIQILPEECWVNSLRESQPGAGQMRL